jgi:hypothetical protein
VTPSRAGPPEGAVVDYLLALRDRERQQLAADIHDGPQQTTACWPTVPAMRSSTGTPTGRAVRLTVSSSWRRRRPSSCAG